MAAMASLRGRDLIADDDLTAAEMLAVLDRAAALKDERRRRVLHDGLLRGKTIALIFQKPSTRTRVAFEAGIAQLCGQALFLASSELQLGRGETIEDTGLVLARYVDAIMARVGRHEEVAALAGAGVPTINGLSDLLHPTQALADMLTLREHLGGWRGRTLAYVGAANNVAHSLLLSGATLGLSVRIACPPRRAPRPEILARAERLAAASGGAVATVHDPREGVVGADVIYTDVWRSMGDPDGASLADLEPFRVTPALMAAAGTDPLFMHCLPLLRGQEVAAEVADGPRSIVFDQAENRLHLHKALLVEQLGG